MPLLNFATVSFPRRRAPKRKAFQWHQLKEWNQYTVVRLMLVHIAVLQKEQLAQNFSLQAECSPVDQVW